LTAWSRSLIIRFNTLRRKRLGLARKPVATFLTLGKAITLAASQKRATAALEPSGGIHMHPLLFILGFFGFILVVFGLMELHARSIIKRFEQAIKHSQE
jgi:hypothetical protein